jgi:hypothetical protein
MSIRQRVTNLTRLAAVTTAAECSRVTDIGLTVRDGNVIKGSGSATLDGSFVSDHHNHSNEIRVSC